MIPVELRGAIEFFASTDFTWLVPVNGRASSTIFFQPGTSADALVPSVESRLLSVRLPFELKRVYEHYSHDTEFTANEWTFMSEDEMQTRHALFRDENLYDIAFTYMGMGHVKMLVYDARRDCVFLDVDGGANGYDRESNARRRVDTQFADSQGILFAEWRTNFCDARHATA